MITFQQIDIQVRKNEDGHEDGGKDHLTRVNEETLASGGCHRRQNVTDLSLSDHLSPQITSVSAFIYLIVRNWLQLSSCTVRH